MWNCSHGRKNFFVLLKKKNPKETEKTNKKESLNSFREVQKPMFHFTHNQPSLQHHTQGLQLCLCQATATWKARRKTLLTLQSQEHQDRDQPSNLTESQRVGAGRGLISHFHPFILQSKKLRPAGGKWFFKQTVPVCGRAVWDWAQALSTVLFPSHQELLGNLCKDFLQEDVWKPFHKFAQRETVFF